MMRQKSTENLLDAYTRSNSVYAESGNWFLIRLWAAYAYRTLLSPCSQYIWSCYELYAAGSRSFAATSSG
jgi:hypothetical protein